MMKLSPSSQRVWIEISMMAGVLDEIKSPSSQRVWIEIGGRINEGYTYACHPLHRGCGLKYRISLLFLLILASPSSQRVWIEISMMAGVLDEIKSPSSQRVWIEIGGRINEGYTYACHPLHRGCGLKLRKLWSRNLNILSPSSQRVWIEIKTAGINISTTEVTLFTEGVD